MPRLRGMLVAAVFLFKHSTTCPISAAGYRAVAEYLQQAGAQTLPLYLVKVIKPGQCPMKSPRASAVNTNRRRSCWFGTGAACGARLMVASPPPRSRAQVRLKAPESARA